MAIITKVLGFLYQKFKGLFDPIKVAKIWFLFPFVLPTLKRNLLGLFIQNFNKNCLLVPNGCTKRVCTFVDLNPFLSTSDTSIKN